MENISVDCRLKETPRNAEDVLFPSIHSGVENHLPANVYNISLGPCTPPSLSVVYTILPFGFNSQSTKQLTYTSFHLFP